MALKELYINLRKADLPNTSFTYTMQVNDFFDLKNRESSYSENLKLPKSPTNAQIFELAGSLPNDSVIPYFKLSTDYIVGGVPVVRNGWGFLQDTDDENYNFHFVDGNIDLYRAIENLKLTDLPCNDFSHTKNIDSVVETWTQDKDYVYAIADYGGIPEFQNKINIDFLIPSISLQWIWDKMFEITGFRYRLPEGIFDGQYLTTSDSYEDVGADGTFDPIYENTLQVSAMEGTYHNRIGEKVAIIRHLVNENESHELVFYAANDGVYEIIYQVEKQYKFKLSHKWYDIPDIAVARVVNGQVHSIIKGTRRKFTNSYKGYFSIDARILLTDISAGETLALIAVYPTSFALVPFHNEATPTNVSFTYKSEAVIQIGEFLSDLPLKDLFSEILIQKALTPIPDKKTGVYRFFTLDERLNAPVIDWSDKNLIFKKENYDLKQFARNNQFIYKYNEDGDNHNDYTLTISNEQLKEFETINSKFYSAERNLTTFNSINKDLPKLKFWQEELKESNDQTTVEYKELKNHYHWIHVTTENENINITSKTYSTNRSSAVYKYASFEPFKWENIIQSSYANIGKVTDKMKQYEFYVPISPLEAREFDFFCRIYHGGVFYIPNKIKYESEDLSLVELIKISDF